MLHVERWGTGPPLVAIHGFTQSGAAWGAVGEALAAERTVIAVDAPGHGRSAAVAADLWHGADLLVQAAGTPAAWLGYSMGGRFALHVALAHPGAVRCLVVVSATGGIDDPGERAARRAADEQRARRVEEEGVAAFVREWLAQPLFASLPPEAAALESRLGGSAAGLASSLRLAGTGNQEPLWDRLGGLTMPVLAIAGERDEAYVARAERLVSCIGANARLAVVPGAGHACHLEQPDAFLAAVQPFLASVDPAGGEAASGPDGGGAASAPSAS